jgi:hypothetical protein
MKALEMSHRTLCFDSVTLNAPLVWNIYYKKASLHNGISLDNLDEENKKDDFLFNLGINIFMKYKINIFYEI